ncbi:MAG: ATP-dependent helicase PcrA, partial [Oscillospiraceae bacterium]|nr:ATP-dependent helicase PcrA [Oscillospiraceae bacterium]
MLELKQQFNSIKHAILEKEFGRMNDMQKKAVFRTRGPVLILAGAGSGKTTVIVNRIAFLVNYGNAYFSDWIPDTVTEDDIGFMQEYLDGEIDDSQRVKDLISVYPANPWNILAITFTNKAANELKERLHKMLGERALDINAGTFHSACVRILRREIERLGYTRNFTIYDSDDSVRVIKDCLKELNISDKNFPPKSVLGEISRSKDTLLSPQEYEKSAGNDYRKIVISKIYERYQHRLESSNAVDFDDIICLTVKIFEQFPEVLEYYQNRYRYVLVDEYQDTNHAQYKLVSLLSQKHQNLCVVGDDDQSIYRFRGATIENIMSFENQFDDAVVVRLEQNYRSTQTILDAANGVIKNNLERKGKNLWTDNDEGEKISVYRAVDELGESQFIADKILENVKQG